MKKIYTLAMFTALGALMANAQESVEVMNKNLTLSDAVVTEAPAAPKTNVAKVPTTLNNVVGEYVWTFKKNTTGGGNGELNISIEAKEGSTNEVLIKGLWNTGVATATIDPATGTITIPKQKIGTSVQSGTTYDVYLMTDNASKPSPSDNPNDPIIGTVGADGNITFTTKYISVKIEGLGWFILASDNVWTKEKWEKIGETTFKQGFFGPMYGKEAKDVTCSVFTNKERPGYYRISGLFAIIDAANNTPVIFNASNPDCVWVETTLTNINTTGRGITYILSRRGNYNSDADFLNSANKAYNITLKDGKINVPAKAFFWWWPNWEGNETSLHVASKGEDSVIPLPTGGINDIVVDNDENAPVEYYNLQGVKINEPVNGSLVIRRQGNKVEKIVVR